MVAFFLPPAGFQRNGPRKTWISSANNAIDTASISFGNFVVPSAGLLVALLTCHGAYSRTMSSVSIGGSAATLHATHGASGTRKAAIASRLVSAGTYNVTAVLSGLNGTSPRNFCGCWLLTDYISATPVFAQYNYASSTTLVSVTQDIPKYAAALYQVSETDSLPTFTSAAVDSLEDTGPHRCYWASRRVKTPEPGHVETATYGGSGTHLLFNAAIWA